MLSTHATQLERWLGPEAVKNVSDNMRDWYGPPIALAGVPGRVYAHGGGDFRGRIATGRFASALDVAEGMARRLKRGFRHATDPRRQAGQFNAGFTSLSDLIAEATTGKSRYFHYQKTGTTKVVNSSSSLWRAAGTPPVGATPGNPATGTAYTNASTGGFPFTNPTGGDTQHFVKAEASASVIANTLMLYDLLFGVNKTINSVAAETVSGVPTRYQSVTPTDPNYVGGNFLFIQAGGTAIANTAHNHTVCTYTDQGAAGSTMPSLAGNPGAVATIVDRFDMPVGTWFCPLETGDVGIQTLTQIQTSALVATGVMWFMIGHPIALIPHPLANLICVTDGIMTAFNLTRIFDDACLAFIEMPAPATTATNYTGVLMSVSG